MSKVFAIVAGEASGDQLGAPLIKELKKRYPDAKFIGIGGDKMIKQGLESLFEMERLSVMGLFEVLSRLPELLKIRKTLKDYFIANPPDVFIGIDAPDFNLPLAKMLKLAGIKTVHYVCPSVWAWREKRVEKIKLSVDTMLCLLPFEVDFCNKHQLNAKFVGHTLADKITIEKQSDYARKELAIDLESHVLCMMPGSRQSEIKRMAPLFIEAVNLIHKEVPFLHVIIPVANEKRKLQLNEYLKNAKFDYQIIHQNSIQALNAANVALITSGTAALEAMLCKTPMVVSYKANWLTYKIISKLLTIDYVSLPNIIANKPIVKELIQDDATVDNIKNEMLKIMDQQNQLIQIQEFATLHKTLIAKADIQAANAIDNLIKPI
ncbi:MAG: lipid-A-disaccharide synthase [Saccharospirillaceae bacterium]|nr:lipid-A-disaccharide synthase [Pseudomonadales bacterium]NRB78609.1 lipid-A-disaccharide synthase [Saccharospirillaceae bacterium]